MEEHEGRPFQELFANEHRRYALPNQLDYMLSRANQEINIRQGEFPGIQDGGLEQDFHIFTKLFHKKGYLTSDEFDICQRQYRLARSFLPLPDLVVWLKASPKVIAERFHLRNRRLNIAKTGDIAAIDDLLNSWLEQIDPEKLVVVDGEKEDQHYADSIQVISKLLIT
jgi:deoxyadenosine/deoxycytidine kinase